MNFAEHLKSKGLLDQSQLQKVYEEGEHYFLQVKKLKLIDNDLLFDEALTFYNFTEIVNVTDLKADAEKTMKVGDIFSLLKDHTVALELKGKDYFLVSNPDDTKLIDKIKETFLKCNIAMARDIERESIIKRHVQPLEIEYRASIISKENDTKQQNHASRVLSEAQVLYKSLIDAALENRASDMHITPLRERVKISFRIDGKIAPYTYIPINVLDNIKNILCNEAKVSSTKPSLPIEGKITYTYHNEPIDVRINIIPAKLGFDINLRFLSSELKKIEDIGFLDEDIKRYKDLLSMTKGLIVITGPTGSGKTTSLYAGLNDIKNSGRKIMTLEDPIEITLEGITQIDIKKEQGFGYAQAIATTLRHDPDITLIGETRTLEVAEESIRLADTGHLAATTMHTRDSISTISRYINLGVSPYALGDALSAVIAQRLVRRICPHCAIKYELSQNHYWREMFNLGNGKIELLRPLGCARCDGRGYKGRIAIVEFLIVTEKLSAAVQHRENRYTLLHTAKENGFETMIEDGVKKSLMHITTLDELEPLAKDI